MPVDFQTLKERRPQQPFVDHPFEPWGDTVRIRRLPTHERLELIALVDGYDKEEDGKTLKHDADTIAFGVELLARTIINTAGETTFDNQAGRDYLAAEEITALQELVDVAMTINNLGNDAADDVVEAEKKSFGKANSTDSLLPSANG